MKTLRFTPDQAKTGGKKIAAAFVCCALVAGLPGPRAVEAAVAAKTPARVLTGMPNAASLPYGAGAAPQLPTGQTSVVLPSLSPLPQPAGLGAVNGPAVFNFAQTPRAFAGDSSGAGVQSPVVSLEAAAVRFAPASPSRTPRRDAATDGFAGLESPSPSAAGSQGSLEGLNKEIAAVGPVTAANYGAVASVLSKFFSERPSHDGEAAASGRALPVIGWGQAAASRSKKIGLAAPGSPQDAPEFEPGKFSPGRASADEALAVNLFERTSALSDRLTRWDAITAAAGVAVALAAGFSGAFSGASTTVYILFSLATLLQVFPRTRALVHFQNAWPRPENQRQGSRFSALFKGESRARGSASWGRVGAWVGLAGAAVLAWVVAGSNPVVAALIVLAGLPLLPTLKASAKFGLSADLLKIVLLSGLRQGRSLGGSEDIPGATALEKRYWFLGENGGPAAKLMHTYRQLLASGLPVSQALFTAFSSHLLFAQKTQKGLTGAEKKRLGLGFFDIYLPYLVQAQSLSNSRIYAGKGNSKGLLPGELDMAEFEEMFRLYAPGRDYMTAGDFARMRKGNSVRDAREGRGNSLSRWFGELAAKRRSDQLLMLFSDAVVVENGEHVPAVSRGMLLRFYQGSAQYDIMAERKL